MTLMGFVQMRYYNLQPRCAV